MPETSNYATLDAASKLLPLAAAPPVPSPLYQEKGSRFSRHLPYRLRVHLTKLNHENKIDLLFENKGKAGVVYHVYDLNHLDQIPRRYTVEAGKSLSDQWDTSIDKGLYDLEVYGPNGYFQKFSGNMRNIEPEITLDFDHRRGGVEVSIQNTDVKPVDVSFHSNAYDYGLSFTIRIAPGKTKKKSWDLKSSANWYDFSVKMGDGYLRRFGGRVETGKAGVSDPAMAFEI